MRGWSRVWLPLVLAGCDDHVFPNQGGGTSTDAEGWCGVRALLRSNCESCHQTGGISIPYLETDPHGALVDVVSPNYAVAYVVPGSPDDSLLVQKLEGDAGGQMPPGGALSDAQIQRVRDWITAGAPSDCATTGGGTVAGVHAEGWVDPGVHGLAAKLQDETLRAADGRMCAGAGCHGDLVASDAAPSCTGCHATVDRADWDTTCTFCHGDPARGASDDPLAQAPPQNIDDSTSAAAGPFPWHAEHLESPLHVPYGCEVCHAVPGSALDEGHVLVGDRTPGEAEVGFGVEDAAVGGTYDASGAGTCTVYCHSDGTFGAVGTVSPDDGPLDCGGCHARGGLGGQHDKHLDEGARCAECHPTATVVGGEDAIAEPELHLSTIVDVSLRPRQGNVQSSDGGGGGRVCSGTCHLGGETQVHAGCRWEGGCP